MDQNTAEIILNDTFNHPFNEEKFSNFSLNLLKNFNLSQINNWQKNEKLPSDIKDQINEFKTLGDLKYQNGEKILIAIVKLKSAKIVERSRYIQRGFAKYILDKNQADACLISFFADNYDDWRFSFINIKYSREISTVGKLKTKQILSPLKRLSYLVGKNEPNNTAKLQLIPLLLDQNETTIDQIEKAFSVEKITKEFFDQYKRLCFIVSDELKVLRKKDKNIDKNFKKLFLKEIDFAKKFMGQLIFLYFIQKKGWIGIKRNQNGLFSKWGSGPKNFLRKLFNKEYCDYKNFFNDILEDLFYVALSVDLPDNYYPKLECKVPFLNGGLFEPINDYNWKETDITIKNETIEEILNIFDTFNFTINEEESLEKDIAIDPETLGKVFENLLDENLQRGHGVFYTPRNIVNYMCMSAVASYLNNELQSNYSFLDCKKFINEVNSYDIDNINSLSNLSSQTSDFFKKNSDKINELLKNIRICDPAVGSGAFPVSMMQVVVKLRKFIKIINNQNNNNLNYLLKFHFIKNNIYGVDIDKSAVEIAKLRLWLSLTLDEENYEKISTLPNLDYKILQGNSLFDDFGVNFFSSKNSQLSLDNSSSKKDELIEKYFQKIKEFDYLNNQIEKKEEREQINDILKKIILEEIESIKSFDKNNPLIDQLINNLNDLDKKINDFFCWNIIFHKIFKKKGGFDIIIANPPYLRQEEIVKYKKRLNQKYKLFNSTSDLYTYFYELSFNLLKDKGTSVFITSNKWMRAKYGKLLRSFFKKSVYLKEITNFGDLKIFENAITNTNITIFDKFFSSNEKIIYTEFKEASRNENILNYFLNNNLKINKNSLDIENFTFLDKANEKIKDKIESKSTQLGKLNYKIYYGLKTSFNDGFVINKKDKEKIIKKSNLAKKFIKPLLRGRDIGKYNYKFNDQWIISIPSRWTNNNKNKEKGETFFKKNFSGILDHLIECENLSKSKRVNKKQKLKGLFDREDQGDYWWELRDCDYYDEFKKEKLVWLELSNQNKFCLIKKEFFLLAGTFMILGPNLKFLNAFLNSKIALYLFNMVCSSSGMSTNLWKKFALEKIPFPTNISSTDITKIETLVDQIYKTNSENEVDKFIHKIDKFFYNYYDLEDNEIETLENQ